MPNIDWLTVAITLLVLVMVLGIVLGLAQFLAPGMIRRALETPDHEEGIVEDEVPNQDATIRHAMALARRSGTMVLMTRARVSIYPVRGISVSVERSSLTEEQDAFLRSRVR